MAVSFGYPAPNGFRRSVSRKATDPPRRWLACAHYSRNRQFPGFAHSAQRCTYARFMVRMRRVDVQLATQVLLLQVAVVTLTLGLAGGMLAFFSHERLATQYEDQS